MDSYIRQFHERDLEVVRDLICEVIDACYPSVYSGEAIKFFKKYHRYENILKDAKEGYTIVLELENRIIGTGTLVEGNIKRVFVKPSYQQKGLGKMIMKKLEKKALANGVCFVVLQSSLNATVFYDDLGYKIVARTFIDLGNKKRLDYYEMAKKLGGR